VYVLANECQPTVLFDLGITCNVLRQPTTSTSFDGILSLIITGGTAPYQIYWNGTLGLSTINNLGPGFYRATVVDYYGDYTATTICSLSAPTATPTPTGTLTPTPTASQSCSQICMYAVGNENWGPAQFVCNGFVNGRQSWTWLGDVNIVWKTTRWELVGPDLNTPISFLQGGGIVASPTQTSPPLSGWAVFGGTQAYTVTAIAGTCPPTIPLQATLTKTNATCNRTSNCDGSITVNASAGSPPYQYSINGGQSWVTSNIFQGLCPNTYTVLTKDTTGLQVPNTVTISAAQNPQPYQLQISPQPQLTQLITNQNYSQKITYALVQVVPTLPPGVTITTVLNLTGVETINGPGYGLITGQDEVTKNNNLLSPTSQTSATQIGPRSFCNPEQFTATTKNTAYSVTITGTDVIQIKSTSTLSITNGAIGAQSNCTTQLVETVTGNLSQGNIAGCTCCSIVPDTSIVNVNQNSVQYTQAQTSQCTTVTFGLQDKETSQACDGDVSVLVTLSPSPYNLDTLSLSDISATLYPQFGCRGVPTRLNYDLATTLPIGTASQVICTDSSELTSFTSYQIESVAIEGELYYDGDTFIKNGRCYTVKLLGCIS